MIGGSKIMVSTPRARVLLDMGADMPSAEGADLFRSPVGTRGGRELDDYLRTAQAPAIRGIYDPEQLYTPSLLPLGEADPRPTAIFLSHAHIDHDGLLGFVREDVEVYAHPDTVRLHEGLGLAGLGPQGKAVTLRGIVPGEPVVIEDIAVEAIRVDHDIPGACGFLITTPDSTLAYTGDLNFHRNGGANSHEFVRRVRGVDALVTETTMLSWSRVNVDDADDADDDKKDDAEGAGGDAGNAPGEKGPTAPRSEAEIARGFAEWCARTTGDGASRSLHLLSTYERDVERATLFITSAAATGRTLIWPGQQAALLHSFGVAGVITWDGSRPQRPEHLSAVAAAEAATGSAIPRVGLEEVRAAPGRYVVEPDAQDIPALLDLPLGPGSAWIHSQGEPLGPYMPAWAPLMDWLTFLGVEAVSLGSTGHATGESLVAMVERILPGVVYPIHGFRPEALVTHVPTVLPEYGVEYRLGELG